MITTQNGWLEIPGFRIGHAQDAEALTGCTVVLCETGAVAGVDQRGGAPGTRETDAISPLHLVDRAQAVLLTGGSAFGLDAAGGVMRYLEEQGAGYPTGVVNVPIVPAAVLFDLAIGRADVRPDAAMGYRACLNASASQSPEGNVGAGTGATVGKFLGMGRAMKAGLGIASLHLTADLRICAVAVVNALGDVVDPQTNKMLAGVRGLNGSATNTLELMHSLGGRPLAEMLHAGNTTLGVVLTNAKLTREQATKIAQMAQNGLARAVQPAHTLMDGDTIFTLANGDVRADSNIVGALAAEVFAAAVVRAVRMAKTAGGIPAAAEINPSP